MGLAPRKGRGLALPTFQGGARREGAACPGIPSLGADNVRELRRPPFPFPLLFILTLAQNAAPPQEGWLCRGGTCQWVPR